MLLNYESSYNFLSVIIQFADDENLVQAAVILRNHKNRAMQYQLNYFNETLLRIGVFTGRDVFLDTIVIEMLKNDHLALSAIDQFALETLANGYGALSDALGAASLVRGLGVFAADMLGGISNVFNRVVEIQAMYQINQALIRSTENLRRSIRSENDLDEISRVVQNMRYMMYVNARGDYALYQMLMYDGQLLSLLVTDHQSVEEWYSIVQEKFPNLIFPLEHFWPQREWFKIELDSEYLYHGEQESDEVLDTHDTDSFSLEQAIEDLLDDLDIEALLRDIDIDYIADTARTWWERLLDWLHYMGVI